MPDDPAPTWLTPAAYHRLEEELEHLTTQGRADLEDRLAEARSHGDIRENAEYDAAKNEQGLMEARIRTIRHLLRTAQVGEAPSTNTVEIGSVVTVRDAEGAETEYFVAPQENKVPGITLASPSSPLGAALLGARVGKKVNYHAPGGVFTLEIVAVRPFNN
jgi:transcription elongation factor GreA